MKKSKLIWKKFRFAFLAICIPALMVEGASAQGPIIIDHTCTDISSIPDYWIEHVKNNLRLAYAHTSHGSQLVSGMNALENFPAFGNMYDWNEEGSGGALDLDDYFSTVDDLGYEDDWAPSTRAYLDDPANANVNAVMWSWCDIGGHDIPKYLANMEALISEYGPGGTKIQTGVRTVPVTFIFMTGHANGGGEGDSSDSRNVQIRNHCLAYNRVLFDFSDMENYDPDNNYYLDKLLDDALYYDSNGDGSRDSNWASEYLAAHPGSENYQLIYGDGGSYSGFQESCAHSPEGGETNDATLNCVLKGKAVWWMLAGLAGWDSECASYNPATGVLHIPYLVFGGQSYWLEFNVTEQGLVLGNFGPSKGTGACATWTGSVLQIDCLAVDDSGATYWLNLAPSGSNWALGSWGTN